MDLNDDQRQHIIDTYGSIEEWEHYTKKQNAIQYLADTDYIIIKSYEYFILGKELDKDYSDIFIKREECREILRHINDIQEKTTEED